MSAHFNEIDRHLTLRLQRVSLAMFRKNFLGIFHGSISARLTQRSFLINNRRAVFDHLDLEHLISVNITQDYRWLEASMDTPIHAKIYEMYKNAKFVAYTMPPYTVSYSLKYATLRPLDFYGREILGEEVEILDCGDYQTWNERAVDEISQHIGEKNRRFLIIKGYGIYIFDRDLHTLAKKIAIIENTCKILHFRANLER